jgi:hypothetical protein
MAEERDIWIEFIGKLRELTEGGKLRWQSLRLPEGMQGDPSRRVSIAFESEYKDRKLRLYETTVKRSYQDDVRTALARGNPLWQEPLWQDYTVLELVDENGAAWEFPNIKGLDDLLETVKFQAAGVKEFIKAILAEETSRP